MTNHRQRLEAESKPLAQAAARAAETAGFEATWGEDDNGFYVEAACDAPTLLDFIATARLSLRRTVIQPAAPDLVDLQPTGAGRVEAALAALVEAVRAEAHELAAGMEQEEAYPLLLATSLGSCIAGLDDVRLAVIAELASIDPELSGLAEEAHHQLLRMRKVRGAA